MFWDNYKGILMVLVVFGHFIHSYAGKVDNSLAEQMYNFIYTFHMPAFVFCSGYFSKSERSRSTESLIKLVMYYLAFNTVMMVFAKFYLGSSIKVLTPYYSFWYLLSLIAWRAVIGKIDNMKGMVILAVGVTLAMGFCNEFTNVLSIRRTVGFFVFFAAGYVMDRSKFDAFLERRKPVHIVVSAIVVAAAAVAAWWAVKEYGITSSMTMMGAYRKASQIWLRVLLLAIASAAIGGLLLIVPNCKIPLVSQVGRNSLLVYLGHRFLTLVYYTDFFHWKNYSRMYLVYAVIATVVTCVVLSNEKLNVAVTKFFDGLTASLTDRESRWGGILKSVMMVIFIVVLAANYFE